MHRRSTYRWLIAALVVVIAATAFGCNSKTSAPGTSSPTSNGPQPTVTPYAGKIYSSVDVLKKDGTATKHAVVKWGWMFETSGPLGPFGQATGDGVKMAVQEINDAGGFQLGDTIYTIDLLQHDTRSDVQQTVAAATGLVLDDKVNVIWGPASVGEAESSTITQQKKVIQLCACEGRAQGTLSSVAKAHGESHWAFETLPAISALFPQGARELAVQHPEYKTFAILCNNDATGQRVCQALVDAYQANGFQLVDREDFPPLTSDYAPYLTKVAAKRPDILLNYVEPGPPQINLLKKALELGIGKYYGAISLPPNLVVPLVGDAIKSKIVGAGGYPRQESQPTSAKAAQYFERYKTFRGGQLPLAAFVSLLTYDFSYMLVGAMQQAGTVQDTTKIADALATTHYNGVGEDDIYFNQRHIGVEGGDGCTLYQDSMTCQHSAPPVEILN